jgi:hypothetical protein
MYRGIGLGIAMLFSMYILGAESAKREMFPWPQLAALKHEFSEPQAIAPSRYVFEANGRLVADETKTEVGCPRQTDRTMVLLTLGQSNAANHVGQRYRSEHGAQVINFFGSRCFVATSPLLGSTDTRGEYWTSLGNRLIASGRVDNVVIAPIAFDGSSIARWAQGGDLNPLLIEAATQLRDAGYRVTDILWVQGESDYVLGTSTHDYRERFLSMVDTLRRSGISAPIYASVATKCLEPTNGGFKVHAPDNAVTRAQLALPMSGNGIRKGVNSDALLDDIDRYDDCHIGGSGAEKLSRAWADLLLAEPLTASMQ